MALEVRKSNFAYIFSIAAPNLRFSRVFFDFLRGAHMLKIFIKKKKSKRRIQSKMEMLYYFFFLCGDFLYSFCGTFSYD